MPFGPWFARTARDFSYGLRMLRKNPAFSAITVLTLALGIGAVTAMFSVVDCLLLRPLPYKEPDGLVLVWEKPPKGKRNSVFTNLVGITTGGFSLSGNDTPERVDGMRTSWDFFSLLGVTPAIGRGFAPEDDRPGAPRVTIISHGLWQRRFAGDPRAIGQSLLVDGEPCTIVGVAPAGFRFFFAPEIWVPMALDRTKVTWDFHFLVPLARLKPGVTLAQARADMEGIAKNIERAYPKSNKGWGAFVEPLRNAVVEDQQQAVLVLFGAVGFLLLIACVNVANLRRRRGSRNWRCARRWEPDAAGWWHNCSPKAFCWLWQEARWAWRLRSGSSERCTRSFPPACSPVSPRLRRTGGCWRSRSHFP